jgi:hypothetical protein
MLNIPYDLASARGGLKVVWGPIYTHFKYQYYMKESDQYHAPAASLLLLFRSRLCHYSVGGAW